MNAHTPGQTVDAETSAETSLDAFRADRTYLGADHARNERRTRLVAAICVASLAMQVAGGLAFNSMALVAGGLHMAGHVAALAVAAAAYALARRYAADRRFTFGAGKFGYLAAFANAVVLAVTAILVLAESLGRLFAPADVGYDAALPLAGASLAVNLLSAWLLRPARRDHDHDEHGDLNLSVAHLHLTADAAVSALAILGLAAGRLLGWSWADPAAGVVGALLIGQFAYVLLRRAGATLLDMNPSPELAAEVRRRLEGDGARVLDLHLWRLGPGHHAAIVTLAGGDSRTAEAYRARLAGLPGLSHVTIELRAAPAA
ncbi:CDF family Co(II)/Ni(II) efflux transporter DmeF [Phenylobacterium sp.]|uniref:CDF family Co(II)/Ni(II) efflux transporter DmeF n=1 Tax=Phenylobacterium sp. TaxID=1871053 RepID=UPI0035AE7A5D